MKHRLLVTVAVSSILKNKMRTFLTVLGIVIGVGAVIVMVAVGNGAAGQIQAQINTLGTNLIVITPGSTSQSGASQGAGAFNRLTVDDVNRIKRDATLITAVSPVIVSPTQVVGGQGNWRTDINGVSTDYLTIRNWTLARGAPFDDDDVRAKRKIALLGNTVASTLFPDTDPVGARIRLGHVPFTVGGVLAAKGQAANGTDQDDIVLVPYTTAQDRLSGFSFLAQIVANTAEPRDVAPAEEELREIMRDAHALGNGAPDDFTVRDQTALAQTATNTTSIMSGLLAAIASISLLVGGIGIMNIMLVSVTERTREIGIRMALGARGSDVLAQFLVESVVLCVLGGLAGFALGTVSAAILGHLTGWRTSTPASAVLLAIGFSGIVGVFFGYYPARTAAALDPIQALRYE
jgi:putative ABC transport system permease protein